MRLLPSPFPVVAFVPPILPDAIRENLRRPTRGTDYPKRLPTVELFPRESWCEGASQSAFDIPAWLLIDECLLYKPKRQSTELRFDFFGDLSRHIYEFHELVPLNSSFYVREREGRIIAMVATLDQILADSSGIDDAEKVNDGCTTIGKPNRSHIVVATPAASLAG